MTKISETTLKQQARDAATARLKAAHEDEFADIMREEHEARGVQWNPRLNPEQKARKEIERLAKEFGIPLAFEVRSDADASANVDIRQAAFSLGEHVHQAVFGLGESDPVPAAESAAEGGDEAIQVQGDPEAAIAPQAVAQAV